ncbi:hypothetical protein [uncultured Thiodictyon sp.]|uniref:hypothetical protein n=1 Tax=uncultured Thiodictyon sp. TaxID=1846217 RepID=UPI0025CFC1C0|nr:hypothetical protein [uncultured Thiodictyon sp.]
MASQSRDQLWEPRLWLLQRVTAVALALWVGVHLITILAVGGAGLSAEQILGRTRHSAVVALFYGSFVLLAAIHGALGVRVLIAEWTPWRGTRRDGAAVLVAVLLVALGGRALWAVVT